VSAPVPGDWRGLVVIVATISWDGLRLSERSLAEQLAAYAPILYVELPVSPLTRGRSATAAAFTAPVGMRVVAPRIAALTPPALPGKERAGIRLTTAVLMRRAIRRAVRDLGGDAHAMVMVSPMHDVFGAAGERRRVFWLKDDYGTAGALIGSSANRLLTAERALAAKADTIVTASAVIEAVWRERGREPVLIPAGVDTTAFATTDTVVPAPDVSLPRPVAGFVGQLSDRIDVAALAAVAQRGRSLLLVGPRKSTFDLTRLGDLLDRPNVQWVGAKQFAELPSYLAHVDVGLVPYADSAFNRASAPLKTLEYLAAGCAVVSTDLAASRALGTDLIDVTTSPAAFADAVDRRLDAGREEGEVRRRRAFAEQHSWAKRARQFAEVLELAE
jgi:glycosyltransferase involved in cell wall biosynthesis